jgi:hypothetical protein
MTNKPNGTGSNGEAGAVKRNKTRWGRATMAGIWMFHCPCKNVWSSPASGKEERAPYQDCRMCGARVKGGL